MSRYRDRIDVLTAGQAEDAAGYGHAGEDWDHPDVTTYLGWFGLAGSVENPGGVDKVATRAAAHLPAHAVVSSTSRVRHRGVTYAVDGRPVPASHRGRLHHYELALDEVT